MSNMCPVCGYPELKEPAYDNGTPSYEICPSCGFQFGYTDDSRHVTANQWRQQWIAGGMIWDKGRTKPPPGWNPSRQLLSVGEKI